MASQKKIEREREREIAHGKRNKWEKGIKGKDKGIRQTEEEKKKENEKIK